MMLEILYYPNENDGPVKSYFDWLAMERPKAFARLVVDIEVLGAEGVRTQQVIIRPLGEKLWELKRLYDGVHYRIFFVIFNGAVWLLHYLEKKSAKTPRQDLDLARKRLREVISNERI